MIQRQHIKSEAYMMACTLLAEDTFGSYFKGLAGNLYVFTDDRRSVTVRTRQDGVERNLTGEVLTRGLEEGIKEALKDPRCLGVITCNAEGAEVMRSLGLITLGRKTRILSEDITLTVYNKGEQK